jgi:hypothetical protein
MTDYYPLIARCLADLDKSTTDSRREFYWLARAELEVQLCGFDPPLTELEITRERLALDEAIRKIEADCLPLVEALHPDTTPAKPHEPLEQEVSCIGRQEPAPDAPTPKPESTSEEKREDTSIDTIRVQFVGELSKSDQEQSQRTTAEVLKYSRQPVENLETKTARQSFAQTDSAKPIPQEEKPLREPEAVISAPDLGRIEPRIELPTERGEITIPAGESTLGIAEFRPCADVRLGPPRAQRQPGEVMPVEPAGGSARALITAFLGVLIVFTLALTTYWQRDRLKALFVGSPAVQKQQTV